MRRRALLSRWVLRRWASQKQFGYFRIASDWGTITKAAETTPCLAEHPWQGKLAQTKGRHHHASP